MLSLIGRVDEPLPIERVKASVAEHEEEGRTALTTEELCPNCLASFDGGWQRQSAHFCERCHYVHKRLRVKIVASHVQFLGKPEGAGGTGDTDSPEESRSQRALAPAAERRTSPSRLNELTTRARCASAKRRSYDCTCPARTRVEARASDRGA